MTTYCARNFRGTIGVDLHVCTGGRCCRGGCKPKAPKAPKAKRISAAAIKAAPEVQS